MFVQRYNFFCEKLAGIRGMLYLCTAIRKGALSSAGSERLPYKQRVGGSNPSAPTKQGAGLDGLAPCFCFVPVRAQPRQPALLCYLGAWVPFVALPTRPSPSVSLIKDLCLVARRPTWRFLMGQWLPYSSPSSRLMSCSSARMDCRRPMISDVSLAALWFLFSTAFAAAIFMPRTLSRL